MSGIGGQVLVGHEAEVVVTMWNLLIPAGRRHSPVR